MRLELITDAATHNELYNSTVTAIEEIPKNIVRTESGFSNAVIEEKIYEFTNDERQKHGLSKLTRISAIDSIAMGHSQDMSNRNYFSHNTPEGLDPTGRGSKAGYDCRKDYGSYYTHGLAENLFYSHTYSHYTVEGVKSSYTWITDEETTAKDIVDGWMNSPGHRANILEKKYDKIGVGVVINSDEEVYSTQNFC